MKRLLVTLVSVVGIVSSGWAASIAITNFDFETDGAGDNFASNAWNGGVKIPTGWQAVPGAAPVGQFYGYYNPVDDAGGYISGVSGTPGVTGTMSGPNVFYFGSAVNGQGIQQILSTTFELNTDYTLTVARGTRNSIYNNSLRMILFAGSTLLTCRYRDWETDRKSTRLNSSHSAKSRMPSSA